MQKLQQFAARLFESMTALCTLAVLAAAFSGVFGFSTPQAKAGPGWSPAPPPTWEEFMYMVYMEQQATYNTYNRN